MAFTASSRHEQKNARDARESVAFACLALCGDGTSEGGNVARLKKTVAMVGMMGAGKTAVGTALAAALSVPFVDSDEEIVRAASRSIAEIFERDGEPFFRARESEVLARLLRGPPCILSTGGGAYLAEGNRQLISATGVAVWLRADLDLLWNRVRHKTTRPLLRTANPKETLRALYEARVPFYSEADITVDASPELSIEDMAARVIQALATRPDVLEGEQA
ncbi:shikimate kinase [Rhodobacter sp. ETT8]|uniref:Shikimate kinase n=1 Tax=Pseudotabrizicola algicola TaxID=2709381 RepID=A0A6B3RPA5_9RHOB|nr:shikimate kinase [Pseudotabrizicola algicola]